MEIEYKPSAIKQLKRLPQTDKKKIVKKLEDLGSYPLSGKLLKGELEGLRSLRVWPNRIIFEVQANTIIIYSIAHRQSVYR